MAELWSKPGSLSKQLKKDMAEALGKISVVRFFRTTEHRVSKDVLRSLTQLRL